MFGLIPREEAFLELFKQAAHNMIEGSWPGAAILATLIYWIIAKLA